MKPIGQCVLAFAVLTFVSIEVSFSTPIDFHQEKTGDVLEFQVLDGRRISFENRHSAQTPKPKLSFALAGATIDKIEKANGTSSEEDESEWFSDWSFDTDIGMGGGNGTDNGTKPANPNGTMWNLGMSDSIVVQLKVQDLDNVTHYEFHWPGSELPNEKRELCLQFGRSSWYNSYQRYTPEWPLNASTSMPRSPFNYLLDFQNNALKEEFYMILEHMYITSDGFAIMMDDKSPLFIRRDGTSSEPSICISVNNSYPYLENNPDPAYRDIKLKVFAASNAKTVLDFMMQKSNLIPKPTAVPDDKEFTYPRFVVYSQYGQFINRAQLYDFSSHIQKQGFWNSEIVLNNQWEAVPGDFKFHAGLFGSAQEMTSKLHTEKFRFQVAVKPIVYDTPQNMQAHRQMYIQNIQGQLTTFLDFGTEEAAGLYEADLKNLHFTFGVDSFYATSDNLKNFHLSDFWMQQTPSLLTKKYIETVAKAAPSSTTALAFKTQALPLMVQLSNFQTTAFDQLLKTMIPNVLAVSMAGYSYIIPYHIGGFWPGGKPTEEQYIRMVQASALMPSMSFSWGPWMYSQNAIDITKKMVDLHQKYAPTIIALAKKRMDEGTPIIRPVWYVAPDDPQAYTVSDQFMLGDDIMVAPVVEINKRQRSVYFPPGTWIDSHGLQKTGPKIIQIAANLEDLPFFTRKP